MKKNYTIKEIEDASKGSLKSIFRILFRKHVNLRLSWFFANYTKMSPNQLSFVGILCGIGSAISFYFGNLILGAILYELRLVMDDVDGEVARVKKLGSSYGRFLDNYSGWTSNFFVSLGLCFGMYNMTQNIIFLYLCPFLVFFTIYHFAETNKVSAIMSEKSQGKVLKTVAENNAKNNKGSQDKGLILRLLNKIGAFLSKHNLAEPFNITDFAFLTFVLAPIIDVFFSGFLIIMMVIMIVGLFLEEILYFILYRSILLKIDK